ncbi:MAG: 23S rRNA (adenine(2030)-N(6))-methyltransferase RlmJ [Pseudomonadales bacterium]
MLSYQHDYHAGNHADVLKHAVLAMLVRALQRKPGAIRIIDSHAGSGVYDLEGELAQRGREHEAGVMRLFAADEAPACLAPYLDAVRAENVDGRLRYYPGSPQLAATLLRPQDQLELFELHPQAAAALQAQFRKQRQVHVHRRDGFEGALAVTPPPERRGLLLVDPSYEQKSEYARVADTVAAIARRWANGVLVVWYPLIPHPGSAQLIARLRQLKLPPLYRVELAPQPDAPGMRGSGLIIANLPYQTDQQLEALLPWLLTRLRPQGGGHCCAEWLD